MRGIENQRSLPGVKLKQKHSFSKKTIIEGRTKGLNERKKKTLK